MTGRACPHPWPRSLQAFELVLRPVEPVTDESPDRDAAELDCLAREVHLDRLVLGIEAIGANLDPVLVHPQVALQRNLVINTGTSRVVPHLALGPAEHPPPPSPRQVHRAGVLGPIAALPVPRMETEAFKDTVQHAQVVTVVNDEPARARVETRGGSKRFG